MKISYQCLMKAVIMGIGLMACSHLLFSQGASTFFKRIDFDQNSDGAASIVQADNGYIVYGAGSVYQSPIREAIKIAKIDYEGNVLWKKSYGKPYHIWYQGSWGALIKTHDNKYVFGGSAHDTLNNSAILLGKFDENGDTLWTRTYEHSGYISIIDAVISPDSGFAFSGTKSMPNGENDAYLLKTDKDGLFEWDMTYGASQQDGAVSIDATPDDGYIIGAGTDNFGNGQTDGWNIKVEPTSGQIQWSKTYGTFGDDCGAFTRHVGGYFYVMVHCADTLINSGDFDGWTYYLAKLYPNGEFMWQTFFNSPEVLVIYNVYQLPDGGYLLMGYKNATLFSKNRAWFAKVNDLGEKCWEREYAFNENDTYIATDMVFAPDGGFLFTGITSGIPSTGGSDFMLLKLDSIGCFTPGCDTLNVSIETLIPSHKGFRIWPNPVRDNLHIEYCPDIFIQQPKAVIYNLNGQMVFQKRLPPTNRCLVVPGHALALPDLPAGLYHIVLYDNDRLLAREKVMVR